MNTLDGLNVLTDRVIGAAIEVHREIGPGFPESAYEAAFCHELIARGIPYERQGRIDLRYKGEDIGFWRLDLIVADRLIVELKAVELVAKIHEFQLLAYLRMTNRRLGLLINFNEVLLTRGIRRVVNSRYRPREDDSRRLAIEPLHP